MKTPAELLKECVTPSPLLEDAIQLFLRLDHLWLDLSVRWIDLRRRAAEEARAETQFEVSGIDLAQRQTLHRGLLRNVSTNPLEQQVRALMDLFERAHEADLPTADAIMTDLNELQEKRIAAADLLDEALKSQNTYRALQVKELKTSLQVWQDHGGDDKRTYIAEIIQWIDENLDIADVNVDDLDAEELERQDAEMVDRHKQEVSQTYDWLQPFVGRRGELRDLSSIDAEMSALREKTSTIDAYMKSRHRAQEYETAQNNFKGLNEATKALTSEAGKARVVAEQSEDAWQRSRNKLIVMMAELDRKIQDINAEREQLKFSQENMPKYLQPLYYILDEYQTGRQIAQYQTDLEQHKQALPGLLRLLEAGEQEVARAQDFARGQQASARDYGTASSASQLSSFAQSLRSRAERWGSISKSGTPLRPALPGPSAWSGGASHSRYGTDASAVSFQSENIDFHDDNWLETASAELLEAAKPIADQTLRDRLQLHAPDEARVSEEAMASWLADQLSSPQVPSTLQQFIFAHALENAMSLQENPDMTKGHIADLRQALQQQWIEQMKRQLRKMLDDSEKRTAEWQRIVSGAEMVARVTEGDSNNRPEARFAESIKNLSAAVESTEGKNVDKDTFELLTTTKEDLFALANDEEDLKFQLGQMSEIEKSMSSTDESIRAKRRQEISASANINIDDGNLSEDRSDSERLVMKVGQPPPSEVGLEPEEESRTDSRNQGDKSEVQYATLADALSNPDINAMNFDDCNAYLTSMVQRFFPQTPLMDVENFESQFERLTPAGQKAFMIGVRWAEAYSSLTLDDASTFHPTMIDRENLEQFNAYRSGVSAVISTRVSKQDIATQEIFAKESSEEDVFMGVVEGQLTIRRDVEEVRLMAGPSTRESPPPETETRMMRQQYQIGINAGKSEDWRDNFGYRLKKIGAKIFGSLRTFQVTATTPVEVPRGTPPDSESPDPTTQYVTTTMQSQIATWIAENKPDRGNARIDFHMAPDSRTHIKGKNIIAVEQGRGDLNALFYYDDGSKNVIIVPESRVKAAQRTLTGINDMLTQQRQRHGSFSVPEKAREVEKSKVDKEPSPKRGGRS